MRALHTAATGMMAQELNVEVISNNIANMRTTGFKRQRADFQDLLYTSMRRMGTATSDAGTMVPSGIQMGAGVKTAATPRVMSQGNVLPTERPLDVAIRGEGFMRIELPDGRFAYTRDGAFEMDAQGRLVTQDGYVVQAGVQFEQNDTDITINPQGVVQARNGIDPAPVDRGQIELVIFANKSGLEAIGENLFLETASSGAPQIANPGEEGYGTLLQAYLEQANVNAVSEISDLIAAQRAYEMNSRVISAADEMLSATSNLR